MPEMENNMSTLTKDRLPKLESILERLDGLTRRATVGQLQDWLTELDLSLSDVRRYVRFGEHNYLRNLVRGGPWYHLLVICWRSGQRSPIHNHAASTCGLKVLTGTATETSFDFTPCGLIKATISRDMNEGDIVVSHDAQIHQISNLQAEGTDLVTLHIYSPPLLKMDTYSLTDKTIGQYTPIIQEYTMGGGI